MSYPHQPGFKEGETSRDAARTFESRAHTLRGAALRYIQSHPGRTADQIASALGESLLAIRPRVSELRRQGLIVNEGRGVNPSGHSVHLWRAVTPAELQAQPEQPDRDEFLF